MASARWIRPNPAGARSTSAPTLSGISSVSAVAMAPPERVPNEDEAFDREQAEPLGYVLRVGGY
jgi:hypothetical protein